MTPTEERLSELLHRAAEDPAAGVSFDAVTRRARRYRRLTAAAAAAAIAVVAAGTVAGVKLIGTNHQVTIGRGTAGAVRPALGQSSPGPAPAVVATPGPSESGPPMGPPPPALADLKFTVTVNGLRPTVAPHHRPSGCQSPSAPCLAVPEPGYAVSPGERLNIRVTIGVPDHASINGLWIGISNGTMTSPAKIDAPFGGLRPILLHLTGLNQGQHTARFGWTVPARIPIGTVLLLSTSWAGQIPLAFQPTGQHRRELTDEGTDLAAFYMSRR